jgi:hypothetical protein
MSMSHKDQAECDRNRWSRLDDSALIQEWKALQKACFNRMFGHNARHSLNTLCDVLAEREITEIPNLFGNIKVVKWNEMYPTNPDSIEAIRAKLGVKS